MKPFAYTRVSTIQEAVQTAVGHSNASFIAGGTNLVDRMKAFLDQPSDLIDISRLQMQQIELTANGGLRIGALATNTAIADHPKVKRRYPALSRAILSGASQQIRNAASAGGNLLQRTRCPYYYDRAFNCNKREPGNGCAAITGYNRMHAVLGASDQCIAVHPSDMCVALAALDAEVVIEGPTGTRQIPFIDFHRLPGDTPEQDTHLAPGELITNILLPSQPFATSGVYLKLRDRASYSFALVSVAAAVDLKGNQLQEVRLAMGGVAHKPWRCLEAEQFLRRQAPNPSTFQQAAEIALKDAKPLAHNGFKVELAKRAIRRALTVSAQGGGIV